MQNSIEYTKDVVLTYYYDGEKYKYRTQINVRSDTGRTKVAGVRFGKFTENNGVFQWHPPKKRDDEVFRFDRLPVEANSMAEAMDSLFHWIEIDEYFSNDIFEWINFQKHRIPGSLKQM